MTMPESHFLVAEKPNVAGKLNADLTASDHSGRMSLWVPAFIGDPAAARPAAEEERYAPTEIMLRLGAKVRHPELFVSCLMVTRNRLAQAQIAIDCYRRQSWQKRELVIIDNGDDDRLARWLETLDDASIRLVSRQGTGESLGELRNLSVRSAEGTHICQWDDDDLSHSRRIEAQVLALQETKSRACFLLTEMLWLPLKGEVGLARRRPHEHTLLCERRAMPEFPPLARAEDTPVMRTIMERLPVVLIDMPELYVYVAHGANTSEDHLEYIWGRAGHHFPADEAALVMEQLSRCHPIARYREVLGL